MLIELILYYLPCWTGVALILENMDELCAALKVSQRQMCGKDRD